MHSCTIFPLFHNPSSDNLHLINRPVFRPRFNKPHLLHDPQSTLDPPKNRMFAIQPGRRRQRNEELTPVGILPTVRHTQNTRPRVLETRIDLIFEIFTVYGSAPAASAGGIASLQHEVWDDAVEDDIVVVAAFGEGSEIIAGLAERMLA